jgi:murein DD-endopeptidase MepM/ murein hydrolase activator NlpD
MHRYLVVILLALGLCMPSLPASAGGASGKPGIITYKKERKVDPKAFAPIIPIGTLAEVSANFFDRNYALEFNRQHLGVDIAAPNGSTVVSPVYGKVIFNNTDTADSFGAYIVVEDFNTGWQHIVGHISSNLEVGAIVSAGQKIGNIRTAGTGPHVHWGVNRDVVGALGFDSSGNEWGWGRAPKSVTRSDAESKGWLDPTDLI